MSALSGVLDFLFPPKCVFCHRVLKVGERGCCGKCRQSLLGTCPPRAGVHFTQCYAPLAYEGSVIARDLQRSLGGSLPNASGRTLRDDMISLHGFR